MTASGSRGSGTQISEVATADHPLPLYDGSGSLASVHVAYETWGELNEAKDNAILVFHALTGNHHAAGHDPHGPGTADAPWQWWNEECHDGWWDGFIGPGKAINTDRWFVICANYLGGCYGSTGPWSADPATGKPLGSRFPWVRLEDVVNSQMRLLDHLGIRTLRAAVGGSVGGYCAADLAVRYPDRVQVVVPVASGMRSSTLTRVHNLEQILAIECDPDFNGGDYYDGNPPLRGMTLARVIGHKTFVSLSEMEGRARQTVRQFPDLFAGYQLQHSVESYMVYQGSKFIARFDPNSYLRIMHMWQGFDLPAREGDQLFHGCTAQQWLLFSIDSDVCFYKEEQGEMNEALKAAGVPSTWITVHSTKGHDSFLLEPQLYGPHLRQALNG